MAEPRVTPGNAPAPRTATERAELRQEMATPTFGLHKVYRSDGSSVEITDMGDVYWDAHRRKEFRYTIEDRSPEGIYDRVYTTLDLDEAERIQKEWWEKPRK